ncbi:MAG: DUF881 domain-containing protein [Schwartzia sp.]|nr:DUF881 domain-containing protein [Schwartzia sp. (in: firmicutes)]
MTSFRKGHISIALVCMILGFMLSYQYRIASEQKNSLPRQRVEELAARLVDVERERDTLKEEVSRLTLEAAENETAETPRDIALEELRLRSGLVPLEGPGVIVTIDDSKKKAKVDENENLYVIHDDDLLRVINELRASGAEAISLNGQRLIGTSEIRCAGPTLSVNNVRSAPPYEISAIGDPKTLEQALKMRGGVADTLSVWGITLDIQKTDSIKVPAYKGNASYQFARAAEEAQQ